MLAKFLQDLNKLIVPKILSGVTTLAVTNSGLEHDSSDTVGAASNAPLHSASSSTSHTYLVGVEQLQQTNTPSSQMQQPSVADWRCPRTSRRT